jgi:(p)ppGpp synthase/HD superfamily hydrolase
MNHLPNMNLVEAALYIADKWHLRIAHQYRKYTGEPYTVHTKEVAEIYSAYFPDDWIGKAAAYLHDIFEDTPITPEVLREELGQFTSHLYSHDENHYKTIIETVVELTNQFTSELHPKHNRSDRKLLELQRLSQVSQRAQNLKVCDLISNTTSIVQHDPNFARIYLDEKEALLNALTEADSRLKYRAFEQLNRSRKELFEPAT